MNAGNRSRRIVNREYISDIAGTTGFGVNKFSVNPGSSTTFPWLSSQADAWEQYHLRSLEFHFVPSCATAKIGRVILAPDYDAVDPSPVTKAQVLTYQDTVVSGSWTEVVGHCNPASMFPTGPRKFIRTGPVPGSLKLFDACNFYCCTDGQDNTDTIGELWVSYDIELFVPQTVETSPVAQVVSYYEIISGAQTLASGVPEAVAFELIVDPIGFGTPTLGVFTPPRGAYLLSGHSTAADSANEVCNFALTLYKNGATLPTVQTSSQYNTLSAGGRHSVGFVFYVTCNGSDTVEISAVMTGAGTLTLVNCQSSLAVRVA
jgi:hypothetical protein